ncbi:MAG: hypothetical protein KR126chlam2_00206 [Chlamydiae bacterium]|nr:hypothetical protein [Chlamydiota bacterium]
MPSYLYPGHFDLVSPDGYIKKIDIHENHTADVEIFIENISPAFVGYQLDLENVVFNFKSVLAQLGLNAVSREILLDPKKGCAEVKVHLTTIGPLAREMLPLLHPGDFLGKLFAVDERRRVRNPDYLYRMFGRTDRHGKPLLSLGQMGESKQLLLEKVNDHMVAFLTLKEGRIEYEPSVNGFLPTLGKALAHKFPLRDLLRLHQAREKKAPRTVKADEILLVCTQPLHIRTAFARVVNELLPEGCQHTSANILQPDTQASGDIYELFGSTTKEVHDIPLEFFTLEPHREHVFFQDRDQLQLSLQDPKTIFETFKIAPDPKEHLAAVFVVKGTQLLRLKPKDWILSDPEKYPFPGMHHLRRQSQMVEKYIKDQPSYPFLKAIESGLITSQGVLFTRYFPSPMMKRMLLSYYVQGHLMGLYFQIPSRSYGSFFSQEDRAMLTDLVTFGIPVYWADETSGQLLEYIQRPSKTSGMFVPQGQTETFLKATFFGVYGSNLITGNFGDELKTLLSAVQKMQHEVDHPKLNNQTPLALVTGGGPGAMEVGNFIAKELKILSCANIVDFSDRSASIINEQKQNPYVEAKMTYRLEQLVERQAEFYLDFPIFVMGGIGTDFEFSLEELRHKVSSGPFGPILLFGDPNYWRQKITSRFQVNNDTGTIEGSEWVSNCLFCIQNARQGIKVYQDYFTGKLKIGREGPIYPEGFVVVD